MTKFILSIIVAAMLSFVSLAEVTPNKIIPYKIINNHVLNLHVFKPDDHKPSDNKPAIIFFFGGGWKGGTPEQFYKQSEYFAKHGVVAISAEYRVKSVHQTTPKEAVMDAKSAIRWLRSHANELGVNPDKIAASGGSAGGHLAIAAATLNDFNEYEENTLISAIPNALVLFNPVFDNGPQGYGYERVKAYWQAFSPLHNIRPKMPPTIAFFGTEDKHVPVSTIKKFSSIVAAKGNRFDFFLYEGQPHGFFNKAKYTETLMETKKFLTSIGYIK